MTQQDKQNWWGEGSLGEKLRRDVTEQVERLSAALGAGQPEPLLTYFRAMGRFHKYSWNNVLLIMLQRPDAGRVAGFHTWKRLGRHVKKGAKGIAIMAPVLAEKKDESGEKKLRPVAVKGATVFAEADTDGKPLPALDIGSASGGTPEGFAALLSEARRHVSIEFKTLPQGVYGRALNNKTIELDAARCSEHPGTATTTLFHEWAHCALHFRNEARPQEQRKSRAVQELEAEACAYILSGLHGVDSLTSTNNYIQMWGHDAQALESALMDIQFAVRHILEALYPAVFDREAEKAAASEAARQSAGRRWQRAA